MAAATVCDENAPLTLGAADGEALGLVLGDVDGDEDGLALGDRVGLAFGDLEG